MASSDKPDPRAVAQQLRKPSGEAAAAIGDNMDQVNEPLFELVLEAMEPAGDERVLEIGFGTGSYINRLFSESPSLRVHGIDYSPEMLDIATRKNRKLLESGRLSLEAGESDDLPFQTGFFDKVFCNMVVYFWDRPDEHLKEIHRILGEGGCFYTGMRTVESMNQFPFAQFGFVLYEPGQWMEILTRNGFQAWEAARRLDPVIEDEEGNKQLESVCIAARKI